MKKNGFTLIELLAVIIILAIIALIATPIVLNVIDEARESANDSSVKLYVHTIELEMQKRKLLGENTYNECSIKEDGNLLCGEEEIAMEMSGTKPTSGSIKFSNGQVTSYNVTINGKEYKKDNTPIDDPISTNFTYTVLEDGTVSLNSYRDPNIAIPSEIHEYNKIYKGMGEEVKQSCLEYIEDKETLTAESCNKMEEILKPFIGTKADEIGEQLLPIVENLSEPEFELLLSLSMNDDVYEYNILNIKRTVTSIGSNYCSNGDWFGDCFPNSTIYIPGNIKIIGNQAFATQLGWGATDVYISEGVEEIGSEAFYGNSIVSIVIPASVKYIGYNAFAGNNFIEDCSTILIEGDATRFDDVWTDIGFPAK